MGLLRCRDVSTIKKELPAYSNFVEVNQGDGYQRKLAVISYREDYLMLRVRVLPHQV